MRVLYLTADPGVPVHGGKGASVHVRAMVRALAELGHEIVVASPRLEAGEEALAPTARGVEIPAVRPRSLETEELVRAAIETQAAAVLELAQQSGAEAIYERYSLTSCAGARTARALGLPLVVEVNAPLRDEERRFRQLVHEPVALAAERETFSAAALMVAVSEWLAEWLRQAGVPETRIAVLPNPAPARLLEGASPLREAGRPLIVGFAGSLKPWHGISTLLDGFCLAIAEGARMQLEVLGDGPERAAVDQAAAEHSSIHSLGHLAHEDALDRLMTWDVGVAPYAASDGFYFSPLKVAEYMAAGLCPVVSDVGALAATIGEAGVVVPPDDPRALADALISLDADRDRVRELGRRAQALARRQPTWTESARRVTEAFAQPVEAPVPA